MMPSRQELIDASHLSLQEQADKFGVKKRSVSRWRHQYGIAGEQAPHLTPEQESRISVLASEGMPFMYIARDLHISESAIRERLHRSEGADEWQHVWPSIFNKPTLLALHREFYPPTPRANRDRVAA